MKWPHLYRFMVIGLMTGSRSGAIRSLQWAWVDLDARVMRRRAFGEAEDSRKRTPPVKIAARLARLLRRWKRQDGPKAKYVVHYNGRPIQSVKRTWADGVRDRRAGGRVTAHPAPHAGDVADAGRHRAVGSRWPSWECRWTC
jgi:integrase